MASPYKEALHLVTSVKLRELEVQKGKLDEHYSKILRDAEKASTLLEKVRILHNGIKNLSIAQENVHLNLENMDSFIAQAELDPSTSSHLLEYWADRLTKDISRGQKRCEYAYLFGCIMAEWSKNNESRSDLASWIDVNSDTESVSNSPTGDASHVKTPGPSAKEETRTELEELIFEERVSDVDALKNFLNRELMPFGEEDFETEESFFRTLNESTNNFGLSLLRTKVTTEQVQWAITGLLHSDLLTDEKKATLSEVKGNETIIQEFASVLTIMMGNLESWTWPAEGVFIDLRRALSGKYRAFMDEDIITALFLQYVGIEWSVHLRNTFLSIFRSKIWKRKTAGYSSVEGMRQKRQAESYFMAQLPVCAADQGQNAYDEDGSERPKKDTVDVKQELLHLVNVEAKLHQAAYPNQPFTVVRTDLQWFGPSIPHDVILTIMKFFNVPKVWRNFFRTFLQAPIRFSLTEKPRIRQRGCPIAHSLSAIMSETILFIMDLYVNRTTDGMFLYRIHDDFWFFDKDEDLVVLAWENMQKYARLVGLQFNMEKSGSVAIYPPKKLPKQADSAPSSSDTLHFGKKPLPQTTVRWGFVELHSDGVFRIEYKLVEGFVKEMAEKLADPNLSVIGWVNTFNRYMGFFIRNFGQTSAVFGVQHTEQIVQTLQKVYKQAFGDGDPISILKRMVTERFSMLQDTKTIPDAFFVWPITAGGLGLRNAFIDVLASRKGVESALPRVDPTTLVDIEDLLSTDESKSTSTPSSSPPPPPTIRGQLVNMEPFFTDLPRLDYSRWKGEKEAFEKRKEEREKKREKLKAAAGVSGQVVNVIAAPAYEYDLDGEELEDEFPDFWTWWGKKETHFRPWMTTYERLLKCPDAQGPILTTELKSRITAFKQRDNLLKGTSDGSISVPSSDRLTPYWQWILCHYSNPLLDVFGSLEFMNTDLIPMGMITSVKSAKIQWD